MDPIRYVTIAECVVLMTCTVALLLGHRGALNRSQLIMGCGVLYFMAVVVVAILINALSAVPPTPGVRLLGAAVAPLTFAAMAAVYLDVRDR